MHRRRLAPGLLGAALLLGLALAAAPAAADWLVPRDGDPIEIRGPWEEKDGLVIFRTADGTLASMRLSDVDLAASRALTESGPEPEAAAEPTEPPEPKAPEPPRKAVLVLTDADVAHVDPASQPASGAAGESPSPAGESPQEPAAEERLAVATWAWDRTTSPDGIEVSGELANRGDLLAANVGLRVVLVDREGRLLGRSSARLDRTVLDAGERTGFTAAFPGLFDFANARFEARGFDLVRRPEPQAEPEPAAADAGG